MTTLPDGVRFEDLEVSRVELAKALGLSGSRVGQLVAEGILPAGEHAKYPLLACLTAYRSNARKSNESAKDRKAFISARTRLLEAKAETAEIEREERLGVLVNGEVFGDVVIGLFGVVRTRLLGLPNMLGSHFSKLRSGREAFDWLQKEIYAALEQLSEYDCAGLIAEATRKHSSPFEHSKEVHCDGEI